MKSLVASTVTLAVVCLLTACSPSEGKKRNTRSSPSESTSARELPPSSFVDPWKAAAEWSVPGGPVGDAERFLLNAPAYQFTTELDNLNTHQKAREEGHVVRNEAVQVETTGPHGKNGIITDGKREFVFFQGRYEQEPGDAAATLSDQIKDGSLRSLLNQSDERTPLLGSEKLNGVEAEIYALNPRHDEANRLPPPMWAWGNGHLRVWIAKDDHRPLKVEIKEDYVDQQKPGVRNVSIQIRTYQYDPNVKVILPGS